MSPPIALISCIRFHFMILPATGSFSPKWQPSKLHSVAEITAHEWKFKFKLNPLKYDQERATNIHHGLQRKMELSSTICGTQTGRHTGAASRVEVNGKRGLTEQKKWAPANGNYNLKSIFHTPPHRDADIRSSRPPASHAVTHQTGFVAIFFISGNSTK